MKGGGVIDFFAKLYGIQAKEASHFLAYSYGIQTYTKDNELVSPTTALQTATVPTPAPATKPNREVALPPPEKTAESSPMISEDTHQSAYYIIASIEHQLAVLKQLLATR